MPEAVTGEREREREREEKIGDGMDPTKLWWSPYNIVIGNRIRDLTLELLTLKD